MKSARDLFQHELESLYDGTKRFVSALQQMRKRSSHADLSTKLEELRKAAEEQSRRLEDIFHLMGEKP
jgi:ferritin-like metal-binding protein YciE